MEKKRVFSKSLILLAITSIMLFAMSITSMAATETNMNIQQTGSSSSRVDITWQTYLGQNIHYHVEMSYDGVNWAMQDYAYNSNETIYGLTEGSSYYVRISVYNKDFHSTNSSKDGNLVAVSQKQLVSTNPSDRGTEPETDRSNKEFYIYGMGSSSRCIILSDTHMGKL